MRATGSHSRGFTLVEMSMVLAIIGLLVGAVTVGASLLKSSKLQSAISDYTKYNTAVNQFKQQYGGLPGDLLDATTYWGKDTTNCNADSQAAGTPGTCNGNGDGIIALNGSYDEPTRAWQHLQLAKLITGNYTGTGSGALVLGTNIPKSQITNAGWGFFNNTAWINNTDWLNLDLGNLIAFGSVATDSTAAYKLTMGSVLTPSEAYAIDKKTDDGVAYSGRVITLHPNSPFNNHNCSNWDYSLSNTEKSCSLFMGLSK